MKGLKDLADLVVVGGADIVVELDDLEDGEQACIKHSSIVCQRKLFLVYVSLENGPNMYVAKCPNL